MLCGLVVLMWFGVCFDCVVGGLVIGVVVVWLF